jgi:hypothetical protein
MDKTKEEYLAFCDDQIKKVITDCFEENVPTFILSRSLFVWGGAVFDKFYPGKYERKKEVLEKFFEHLLTKLTKDDYGDNQQTQK